MKDDNHSIQDRFFGVIPKSVLYGFFAGCAAGLILWKACSLSAGAVITVVLAAAGIGIGIWVDRHFYVAKDGVLPEWPGAVMQDEDTVEEAIQDAEDAEQYESDEDISSPQGLRHMFQKNIADGVTDSGDDEDESMEIEEPEGETDIPESV